MDNKRNARERIPADVLVAAEAAGVPIHRSNGSGVETGAAADVDDVNDDDDDDDDGFEFGEEEETKARKLLERDERRNNSNDDDGNRSSSSSWSSSSDDEEDEEDEILDASELPQWLNDIKRGKVNEKKRTDENDDEDVDASHAEPPRTKNEVYELPEVLQVPDIGDQEEIERVGTVVSVVGDVCVVVAEEVDQAPLDETTPLCLRTKIGVGFVEEVFGPIQKPMYTFRYDKRKCKNGPEKMKIGDEIFCVRSMKKTLVPEKLYSKGYDNSGANDEEVGNDDEYSDDEAEAEAKKAKNPKQRKRKEKEIISASKLWEGFVPKHQLPTNHHLHQHHQQQPMMMMQPPIGQMAFMGGMNPIPQQQTTRAPVPGVDFIPKMGDTSQGQPPPPPR